MLFPTKNFYMEWMIPNYLLITNGMINSNSHSQNYRVFCWSCIFIFDRCFFSLCLRFNLHNLSYLCCSHIRNALCIQIVDVATAEKKIEPSALNVRFWCYSFGDCTILIKTSSGGVDNIAIYVLIHFSMTPKNSLFCVWCFWRWWV